MVEAAPHRAYQLSCVASPFADLSFHSDDRLDFPSVLFSALTGELQKLEGTWKLCDDDDPWAWLEHASKDPQWVSDKLLRVLVAVGDDSFAIEAAARPRAALAELVKSFDFGYPVLHDEVLGEQRFKCFRMKAPWAGISVFFELRHFQDFLKDCLQTYFMKLQQRFFNHNKNVHGFVF